MGHAFRIERDLVDVTSNNRPDTSWLFVDPAGHAHRWHVNGAPATRYDPAAHHELPSLVWIVDETGIDEYGDEVSYGHYACAECGAAVMPQTTADLWVQQIPGLWRCYIDDVPVSRDVFDAELKKAKDAGEA